MIGAPVTTRAARPGDIAELLPMVQDLARHHGDVPQATAATLLRDLFGPPPWMRALVAETEGRIVGYAALLPLARLHLGQRGIDLHHLFVPPDRRGLGIGTALTRAALDEARGLGCSYMTVSTQPQNHAAQGFYQRLGFFPAPPAPHRFAFDLRANETPPG